MIAAVSFLFHIPRIVLFSYVKFKNCSHCDPFLDGLVRAYVRPHELWPNKKTLTLVSFVAYNPFFSFNAFPFHGEGEEQATTEFQGKFFCHQQFLCLSPTILCNIFSHGWHCVVKLLVGLQSWQCANVCLLAIAEQKKS